MNDPAEGKCKQLSLGIAKGQNVRQMTTTRPYMAQSRGLWPNANTGWSETSEAKQPKLHESADGLLAQHLGLSTDPQEQWGDLGIDRLYSISALGARRSIIASS